MVTISDTVTIPSRTPIFPISNTDAAISDTNANYLEHRESLSRTPTRCRTRLSRTPTRCRTCLSRTPITPDSGHRHCHTDAARLGAPSDTAAAGLRRQAGDLGHRCWIERRLGRRRPGVQADGATIVPRFLDRLTETRSPITSKLSKKPILTSSLRAWTRRCRKLCMLRLPVATYS